MGNKLPGFGVEFSALSENRCEERRADIDSQGKIASWVKTSSRVEPHFKKDSNGVSAYTVVTFAASSGKQVGQFDCVLQTGSEALPFMKAQLASRQPHAQLTSLGLMTAFAWEGEVQCDWDGWSLTCGGEACVRGIQMRAMIGHSSAPYRGEVAADWYGGWTCSGGCHVDIEYDDSSTYDCGNDGDDGGGSSGGGPSAAQQRADQVCAYTDSDFADVFDLPETSNQSTVDAIMATCGPKMKALARQWTMSIADEFHCHGGALCLKMYGAYIDGQGNDYELTEAEWTLLKTEEAELGSAGQLNTNAAAQFTVGGVSYYTQGITLAPASETGRAFGDISLIFNLTGVRVGMSDYFNFDPRVRQKIDGSLALNGMLATVVAGALPRALGLSPDPYLAHYGMQRPGFSPP